MVRYVVLFWVDLWKVCALCLLGCIVLEVGLLYLQDRFKVGGL